MLRHLNVQSRAKLRLCREKTAVEMTYENLVDIARGNIGMGDGVGGGAGEQAFERILVMPAEWRMRPNQ